MKLRILMLAVMLAASALVVGAPPAALAQPRDACGGCDRGMICVRTASGRQCAWPERDRDGRSDWRDDDRLGQIWTEYESGWTGTWVRRPGTDEFDARWTTPAGERERATLWITLDGRRVTIERRQARGGCTYTGVLRDEGRTASGTYGCDWGPGPIPWSASIR